VGVDLPSSPAYNVEPVTNTSSSSCVNNERRTPRCAQRSLPSVAALFFTLRDSYVRLTTMQRSQIFVQNRVFCLPYLHSTSPLAGFPSEYRHPVWREKTRMAWLPDGEKIAKISLFVFTQLTNVTDRQTYGHRMTT